MEKISGKLDGTAMTHKHDARIFKNGPLPVNLSLSAQRVPSSPYRERYSFKYGLLRPRCGRERPIRAHGAFSRLGPTCGGDQHSASCHRSTLMSHGAVLASGCGALSAVIIPLT
jgi:hypothetical protein